MHHSTNRRYFIRDLGVGLSVLGLGTTAACTPTTGTEKIASKSYSSIVTRKNIAALAPDDPSLKALIDAVGVLKKRSAESPLEPTGWDAHGALHASFCATNNYLNQVHYSWFVWPWHRAYLWSMEKKLQRAINEPSLALHYWDWTTHPKIPDLYWDTESPMYNETRLVIKGDVIPKDFLNVGAALRAPNFHIFGGYPHVTQEDQPQVDGIAEHTFHNNIHNWIGGDMASFVASGYDPIFYAHHGNCDRIWDAWLNFAQEHQNPLDEDWLEKKLYVTDEYGKPMTIKIKELIDSESLGYKFADLDFDPSFSNPFTEEEKPVMAHYEEDTKGVIKVGQECKNGLINLVNAEESTYLQLHFDRVELPYQPYCARIFFKIEGADLSKYIGTYTMLPIVKPGTSLLEKDVYLQMEVDKEVVSAVAQDKNIEIIFEPVPLRNRDIPNKQLQLNTVELLLNA